MTSLLFTLDYEIFFGNSDRFDLRESLLEPTEKFVSVLKRFQAKAVFFVDAGFLCTLEREAIVYDSLKNDLDQIRKQIQWLEDAGHEIQLHVHPHWEDSFFDGKKWHIVTKRYRLDQFKKEEATEIFTRYHRTLQDLIKNRIRSYRAGGWCIQPFGHIAEALRACSISIDSTVYAGGYEVSDTHYYDFRNSPAKDIWKFNSDPLLEDSHGEFIELPIAAHTIHPTFFWQLLYMKLTRKASSKSGGQPITPSKMKILRKLFTRSRDAVSLDGEKSRLVFDTLRKEVARNRKYFVMIGHPKMFSETSFQQTERILQFASANGNPVIGFFDVNAKI